MMKRNWIPFAQHITERRVLWVLVIGFGLVMLLLGVAGLAAVREGRAIRASAAALVREQILLTRLLHEAQVEEDALALVLHRLARSVDKQERVVQLRELEAADEAVERLARDAAATPQAAQWARLAATAGAFSEAAEGTLDQEGPLSQERLERLFSKHDEVVKLIHELIIQSTEHLAAVDDQIGRQLQELADESALLLGAALLLAALCAAGTIKFVRYSIQRIEWQAAELNHVSWHMLQSQEETARRFSHELHDELGQSLAAVRANLTRQGGDNVEDRRADCVHLVDEAIANVRELSQLLRPVILDDFGLDAGLRWLTEKFAQRTRIEVSYESNLEVRLHNDLETHLFRIAQEALTNIARHSGARRVRMVLRVEGGEVRLRIEDDGRGLPTGPVESRQSLGLIGMRARARECGGVLELEEAVLQGLCLMVRVPLRVAEE
jgi:signal transduction histidine kinase